MDTNLGLKCHLEWLVFFNHNLKVLCVYIPMRSLLIQVTYIGKLATFVLTKLPMLKTPLCLGMLFVLSYDCVGKPCLRENAQENRAKRKIHGHNRKPNLPSFSVYREVLTSLQTSWGLFSEIRPICEII